MDLVGLKPILRTTTSFSALTLSVGSFDLQKPVPDMTYNVFSGTLNLLNQLLGNFLGTAFPASRMQHLSDLHSNVALGPHHV